MIASLLGLLVLCGAAELKIVIQGDDRVVTDPEHRYDFVTLARQADSVVLVKEGFRSTDDTTPVVTLEVVEVITGVAVKHLRIAASIWDAIALSDLRREKATFLLMIRDRGEILHVHWNGIPFILGPGVIPIVDDMVPERFVRQYDHLLALRPVTLNLVRQQLSRDTKGK